MRVTIYQPQYFPRLHYFNRILNSDTFVILDSAQYTKSLVHITKIGKERHKSYQSDTLIKSSQGEFFLTIPIKKQSILPINLTEIDYTQQWRSKHLVTLKSAYGKSEFSAIVSPQLEFLLSKKYTSLADLNITTILWGLSFLLNVSIDLEDMSVENMNKLLLHNKSIRLKKILKVKDLPIKRPVGLHKGTEWTAAICLAVDADEYLHGETAQSGYMDTDYYRKKGIMTVVQNWKCLQYNQKFSDKFGFIPNLSIIDLAMNVDSTTAKKILGVV